MAHWSDYLVRSFAPDRDSEVTITINPSRDSAAVVMLASRLAGLVDALRAPNTKDHDPLADEHRWDLIYLLDHLHRIRLVLEGQEERLIRLGRTPDPTTGKPKLSLRDIAAALGVSPETVRNRLKRIEQASQLGYTAAALDEIPNEASAD